LEQFGVKSGHILLDDILKEGYTYLQIDVLPNNGSSIKIGGVMVSSTSLEFNANDLWNYVLSDTLDTTTINEATFLSGYGKMEFQYDYLNNLYIKAYFPSANEFSLEDSLQANVTIRSGEISSLVPEAVQMESDLAGYDAYLITMNSIPKNVKTVEIEIFNQGDNGLIIDSMTFENSYVRPLEIREISQDDVHELIEFAINWYKPVTVDKKFGIGSEIPNYSMTKEIQFLLTDGYIEIEKIMTESLVTINLVTGQTQKALKFTDK
jgi:hypothetical protein